MSSAEAIELETPAPTQTQPSQAEPDVRDENKPKRQPPYAVILHNDDVNSFGYVVQTLRKVFGFSRMRAFRLTLKAHNSGRSLLWSGMKEHAELKAEQIQSCGPDPVMKSRGARPLWVTIEPLPD